jgi:hypothetical protein
MSCSPAEILALADELSNGPTAAYWRSAASRAYYAAYHAARIWHDTRLPAPGMCAPDVRGVHEEFIERLRHPAPETKGDLRVKSATIGRVLLGLRRMRVRADYELNESFTRDEALTAVSQADQVLADCA